VDQTQNGQMPQFLQSLLANPATAGQNDRGQLELLVQNYPQCSIFHLLLAKAAQNSEAEIAAKALQSAAVHAANREVLFRLIYQPELIVALKQEKVYPRVQLLPKVEAVKPDASFMPVISGEEIIIAEENPSSAETVDASFTGEKLVPEEGYDTETTADASFTDEKLVSEEGPSSAENTSINPNQEEAIIGENDLRAEDVNLTFVNGPADAIVFPMEETIAQHQQKEGPIVQEAEPKTANASFAQEIDEEVYDEITAIEDIHFEAVKTASPKEAQPKPEQEKTIEGPPALTIQDKAEKDMLSSIASIDYFTFNNKFGQNQTPPVREQAVEITSTKTAGAAVVLAKPAGPSAQTEPETVSKYHDDKMPYTFLWWLDKTRKEYAGTYQPYVKKQQTEKAVPDDLSIGPELHQQYIESIFHTKPQHEMAENTLPPVVQPQVKRKEDELIERFIIEEPHIHPPSMDKLDTENKAKKSSEDGDVLVTETLAKIYLDQMLYHKALDTYKKLVLKFPEKSRYFTAQIDLIEKKIN